MEGERENRTGGRGGARERDREDRGGRKERERKGGWREGKERERGRILSCWEVLTEAMPPLSSAANQKAAHLLRNERRQKYHAPLPFPRVRLADSSPPTPNLIPACAPHSPAKQEAELSQASVTLAFPNSARCFPLGFFLMALSLTLLL